MTSDHNKMTRHEFLRMILHSGEITKVAQHLALAIVILADDGQFRASMRDLERITGWSKSRIGDHLAELEVFMKVTLGIGRGKSLFELQGVIEDALNKAVVSATRTQIKPASSVSVQPPDATLDTKSTVRVADATSDAMSDMSSPRTQTMDLASSPRTQTKESFPPYPPSKKTSPNGEEESKYAPAPASMRNPSPHMNGVGFVISAQHDLVIPAHIVEGWRKRFPDIPDLEAAMQRLSANILHRGVQHPGWTCPEGWMVGPLSNMNQEARNKNRTTDAEVSKTQRNQPMKTFRR